MTQGQRAIVVLLPEEGEAWVSFLKQLREGSTERIAILSGRERELLDHPEFLQQLLAACKSQVRRTRIATHNTTLQKKLREHGINVVTNVRQLKQLLGEDHPQLTEALRLFSPHIWRQQLKTQLQSMGLLSLPRLRIFGLVALSVTLFSFVVFRLLPSAEIIVHPRQDAINQTTNMYLAGSGVVLPDAETGVTRLPLVTITVTVQHSITFEQISKEFRGTAATLQMSVVNQSDADVTLRKDTRFQNQAGMIFRVGQKIIVPARSQKTVTAVADDTDAYGQIIGERGNVPPDLQWTIPGLPDTDQKVIFGQNRTAGTGGTTAYATVLTAQDLAVAQSRLEQELEAAAKQLVESERNLRNATNADQALRLLVPAKLLKKVYRDIVIPNELIGKEVTSAQVSGALDYTVLAYDALPIVDLLSERLLSHVREGKTMRRDLLDLGHLDVRVIYYDDDLRWAKVTADLTATEEYILDPLSPTGALFAKRVRESVLSLPKADAERIIQNMPEVDHVEISLWPPWNGTLPSIPSHITITPE